MRCFFVALLLSILAVASSTDTPRVGALRKLYADEQRGASYTLLKGGGSSSSSSSGGSGGGSSGSGGSSGGGGSGGGGSGGGGGGGGGGSSSHGGPLKAALTSPAALAIYSLGAIFLAAAGLSCAGCCAAGGSCVSCADFLWYGSTRENEATSYQLETSA